MIDVTKLSGDTIKFGATVTLVDEDTERRKSYQLVGESEADVKSRQGVDHVADRTRPDRTKREGDTVEVNTPGGGKSYEVLKVDFR